MDDTTGNQLDDEEDRQSSEPQVVGLEKIASPDLMRMILQKASPCLGGLSKWVSGANLSNVTSDGVFGQREAELV